MRAAFESVLAWLKANVTLARLPLPMLALAASYGVYQFARLFVPDWVAFGQAAAFEVTYIGLSTLAVESEAQRRRATFISISAVTVSVVYNTLAGLFHRNPVWLVGLPWWGEWILAVLHGAPLAIVAALVADLLLHNQADALAESWRKQVEEWKAKWQEAADRLATLKEQLEQALADRTEAERVWNETASTLRQDLEAAREESAQTREQLAALQQTSLQSSATQSQVEASLRQDLAAAREEFSREREEWRGQEATLRAGLGAAAQESARKQEEWKQTEARLRAESDATTRQLEALQRELAAVPVHTCPYCEESGFKSAQALGGHKGSCAANPKNQAHANGHAKEAAG